MSISVEYIPVTNVIAFDEYGDDEGKTWWGIAFIRSDGLSD